MHYSSINFVVLLLITVVLCQFIGHRGRKLVLVISSLFFIYYAGVVTLLILLSVISITWGTLKLSSFIPKQKKILFSISILFLLTNLFLWKYLGWAMSLIGSVPSFGIGQFIAGYGLPIGISFYTLQAVAYLVDYQKETAQPVKFVDFLLFQSFFGQLIAGPIVRHDQLMPQVLYPSKSTLDRIVSGMELFALGLFKKLVLANHTAQYVDPVFAKLSNYNGCIILCALLLYTIQIWADFSGYVDMGRGAARMCGVELPHNSRSPYLSTSIVDFWKRWHITLSSWLKDYFYIPLGGNRKGILRTYVNLSLTMIVCGLWHGAAWWFVLWGAYHALLLIIYKGIKKYTSVHIPCIFAVPVVFFFVMIGWLIFRIESLNDILIAIKKFWFISPVQILEFLSNKPDFLLLTISFLSISLFIHLVEYNWPRLSSLYNNILPFFRGCFVGGGIVLAIAFRGEPISFIYFAF